MKTYVIIGTIFDMGGGQLYTRNKVKYLKEKGWRVIVFTGRNGRMLIPELKEYAENLFEELNSNPFYFKKKRRDDVIDSIIARVPSGTIIIESNKGVFSYWGEMIARKLNAKHVLFDLDEVYPKMARWEYMFLENKLLRREIAGISATSVAKMFGGYKLIENSEQYRLNFVSTNEILDLENATIEESERGDINIGIITRLDKGYVVPLFQELCVLARNNPAKKICIYLVGDAKDESILLNVCEMVDLVDNLTLYKFGYISPLPRILMDKVDFFIGTAGAAIMTANYGKVTVAVDTQDCSTIGILFYDAPKALYANKSHNKVLLSEYLQNKVLNADLADIEKKINRMNDYCDIKKAFDEHMDYIENSCKDNDYYDFSRIDVLHRIVFWGMRLLGYENYKKLKSFIKK